MGGHSGGEVASRLAVEAIVRHMRSSAGKSCAILASAIHAANSAIQQKAVEEPALRGMGTTTTALYFSDRELFVGHVGDSRCYFIRPPSSIWQLTRDHSLVQEKLRAGIITRDEVKTDKMKNVITRSVGFDREVSPDLYRMVVHPGDVFVVCCDGVSNMLADSDIRDIVVEHLGENSSMEMAAQALIDRANERGADDNVTAIVVQVEDA